MWVRMAKVAVDAPPGTEQDAVFYRAKRATATFYIQRILPHRFPFLLIDRVLDLMEWTDLNEFKHTSVPR